MKNVNKLKLLQEERGMKNEKKIRREKKKNGNALVSQTN